MASYTGYQVIKDCDKFGLAFMALLEIVTATVPSLVQIDEI